MIRPARIERGAECVHRTAVGVAAHGGPPNYERATWPPPPSRAPRGRTACSARPPSRRASAAFTLPGPRSAPLLGLALRGVLPPLDVRPQLIEVRRTLRCRRSRVASTSTHLSHLARHGAAPRCSSPRPRRPPRCHQRVAGRAAPRPHHPNLSLKSSTSNGEAELVSRIQRIQNSPAGFLLVAPRPAYLGMNAVDSFEGLTVPPALLDQELATPSAAS